MFFFSGLASQIGDRPKGARSSLRDRWTNNKVRFGPEINPRAALLTTFVLMPGGGDEGFTIKRAVRAPSRGAVDRSVKLAQGFLAPMLLVLHRPPRPLDERYASCSAMFGCGPRGALLFVGYEGEATKGGQSLRRVFEGHAQRVRLLADLGRNGGKWRGALKR